MSHSSDQCTTTDASRRLAAAVHMHETPVCASCFFCRQELSLRGLDVASIRARRTDLGIGGGGGSAGKTSMAKTIGSFCDGVLSLVRRHFGRLDWDTSAELRQGILALCELLLLLAAGR